MKSLLEEGFIGVDMPPLPENTWQGVRLLRLIDKPTCSTTFSDTSVTCTISENEAITTQGNTGRNGIIRWYEPITGRWLSNDPIGISGGLNQYVFCGNNPINFVDPSGLAVGVPYTSADEAATAAINLYNPESIKTDREAIGIIFKYKGSWYHSQVKWGAAGTWENSISKDDLTSGYDLKAGQVPSDSECSGAWHTHGGPGGLQWRGLWPVYKNAEGFSAADLQWPLLNKTPMYLGTPKGYVKKASPLDEGQLPPVDFWSLYGTKNYNETILQTPKK